MTLGLAYTLNLVDAVADPSGLAWKGLQYAIGFVWLLFTAWYLPEVMSRRKVRKEQG